MVVDRGFGFHAKVKVSFLKPEKVNMLMFLWKKIHKNINMFTFSGFKKLTFTLAWKHVEHEHDHVDVLVEKMQARSPTASLV